MAVDYSPGASYGGIVGMGAASPKPTDIFDSVTGIFDDVGGLVGGFSGDWLSLGLSVLGGLGSKTEQSAAASTSQSALNTSGWVVGEGSATGADLNTSSAMQSMQNLPWWVWAAGTLAVIAVMKKAV